MLCKYVFTNFIFFLGNFTDVVSLQDRYFVDTMNMLHQQFETSSSLSDVTVRYVPSCSKKSEK